MRGRIALAAACGAVELYPDDIFQPVADEASASLAEELKGKIAAETDGHKAMSTWCEQAETSFDARLSQMRQRSGDLSATIDGSEATVSRLSAEFTAMAQQHRQQLHDRDQKQAQWKTHQATWNNKRAKITDAISTLETLEQSRETVSAEFQEQVAQVSSLLATWKGKEQTYEDAERAQEQSYNASLTVLAIEAKQGEEQKKALAMKKQAAMDAIESAKAERSMIQKRISVDEELWGEINRVCDWERSGHKRRAAAAARAQQTVASAPASAAPADIAAAAMRTPAAVAAGLSTPQAQPRSLSLPAPSSLVASATAVASPVPVPAVKPAAPEMPAPVSHTAAIATEVRSSSLAQHLQQKQQQQQQQQQQQHQEDSVALPPLPAAPAQADRTWMQATTAPAPRAQSAPAKENAVPQKQAAATALPAVPAMPAAVPTVVPDGGVDLASAFSMLQQATPELMAGAPAVPQPPTMAQPSRAPPAAPSVLPSKDLKMPTPSQQLPLLSVKSSPQPAQEQASDSASDDLLSKFNSLLQQSSTDTVVSPGPTVQPQHLAAPAVPSRKTAAPLKSSAAPARSTVALAVAPPAAQQHSDDLNYAAEDPDQTLMGILGTPAAPASQAMGPPSAPATIPPATPAAKPQEHPAAPKPIAPAESVPPVSKVDPQAAAIPEATVAPTKAAPKQASAGDDDAAAAFMNLLQSSDSTSVTPASVPAPVSSAPAPAAVQKNERSDETVQQMWDAIPGGDADKPAAKPAPAVAAVQVPSAPKQMDWAHMTMDEYRKMRPHDSSADSLNWTPSKTDDSEVESLLAKVGSITKLRGAKLSSGSAPSFLQISQQSSPVHVHIPAAADEQPVRHDVEQEAATEQQLAVLEKAMQEKRREIEQIEQAKVARLDQHRRQVLLAAFVLAPPTASNADKLSLLRLADRIRKQNKDTNIKMLSALHVQLAGGDGDVHSCVPTNASVQLAEAQDEAQASQASLDSVERRRRDLVSLQGTLLNWQAASQSAGAELIQKTALLLSALEDAAELDSDEVDDWKTATRHDAKQLAGALKRLEQKREHMLQQDKSMVTELQQQDKTLQQQIGELKEKRDSGNRRVAMISDMPTVSHDCEQAAPTGQAKADQKLLARQVLAALNVLTESSW